MWCCVLCAFVDEGKAMKLPRVDRSVKATRWHFGPGISSKYGSKDCDRWSLTILFHYQIIGVWEGTMEVVRNSPGTSFN